MNVMDSIVEGAIFGLVHLLLRPKSYYCGAEQEGRPLKPAIYVINHTSHLDGPLVTSVLRKARIHNLAAKDRFEQKVFGFFLRHTGCIPIDRKSSDLSWVHESLRVLAAGESVAIFPEGAHGKHRQQLPFHPGAAMLASMSDAPIVMVYVDGPPSLLRLRNRLMVSEAFRLPAPEDGINSAYIMEQTELLQSRMKDMTENLASMEN